MQPVRDNGPPWNASRPVLDPSDLAVLRLDLGPEPGGRGFPLPPQASFGLQVVPAKGQATTLGYRTPAGYGDDRVIPLG